MKWWPPPTLRWRITSSVVAILFVLLGLLDLVEYMRLRSYLLDSVATRVRAQAKPVIDNALLNQQFDAAQFQQLASQLVRDLTSAETGALVINSNGEELARYTSDIGEPGVPVLPADWYTAPLDAGELERNYMVNAQDGTPMLVALVPVPPRAPPVGAVVLSTSLVESLNILYQQALVMVAVTLSVLLAAALGIWILIGRYLRPLRHMVHITNQIAKGDLSQRIGLPQGQDEVGQLARSFDDMVDHVQVMVEGQTQTQTRLRQFFTDVSHELRTPLTIISSSADVLLHHVETISHADQARFLMTIRQEAHRTNRLVKDVLLLARDDRTAMFTMQPLNLSALCAGVVEEWRLLNSQRTLYATITPSVWVQGDTDRLKQVMLNLLDNALKHTPATATVHINLQRTTSQAHLFIIDSGPGIDPDILPLIFERSLRAPLQNMQNSGEGLGLAIVKAIVEAHHGTIWAQNEQQGGASFEIRFPLLPSPDQFIDQN